MSPPCAGTSSTLACSTARVVSTGASADPWTCPATGSVVRVTDVQRRVAALRASIPPFAVMRVIEAVSARRAAGLPVIDLSAGQPSTAAPAPVRAAARDALDTDKIGYTNALGIPALRAAIARHYRDRLGLA